MNFAPARSSFASGENFDVDSSGPDDNAIRGSWTENEIILLAKLIREEGLTNAQAAIRMGRTEPSIVSAVSKYGSRHPNAQLRGCMTYVFNGGLFFSSHKGNRICGRCKGNREMECA